GGPAQARYPSRLRVLHHVVDAASKTGRTWSLTYDVSGVPADRLYDVVTADWKNLVDSRIVNDPRYLDGKGQPVGEGFGFYAASMTPDVANRLIEFFKTPGPNHAFLVGGGDWNWRKAPDPQWQAIDRRLDAYAPWNVGNFTTDKAGVQHAA